MKKISTLVVIFCVLAFVFGCSQSECRLPSETKLFLVGVGPCGPDLASVRAVNVIKAADVIVCYPWIKEKFQGLIGSKKIIIPGFGLSHYYGKKEKEAKGAKAMDILKRRDALVKEIRGLLAGGKTVAVLTTGDPLIYDPWAWMLEEFEDVKPYVVPGISSFNAAHAALRKSPTLCPHSNAVILKATEHEKCVNQGEDTIERLAKIKASLVLYAANDDFAKYIGELKKGYPAETPVAVVAFSGCAETEKVYTGTLKDIVEKLKGVKLPTHEYVIYVGEFINYRLK